MTTRSIMPAEMQSLYDDWHMSPGLGCSGFVFLTGVNGVTSDGTISSNAAEQIETAFTQAEAVLSEGGMSFEDVVEVTSYHVGIRQHLERSGISGNGRSWSPIRPGPPLRLQVLPRQVSWLNCGSLRAATNDRIPQLDQVLLQPLAALARWLWTRCYLFRLRWLFRATPSSR